MNEVVERNREGWVYLLKVLGYDNLYKIGRTNNPSNRRRTFNVKLPFVVKYDHLIHTDDMYALEHQLHVRYALKRHGKSEFFELTDDDVQYIKLLGHEVLIDTVKIEPQGVFRMKTDVKPKNAKVIDPNDVFNLEVSKRRSIGRRK